MLDVLLTNWRFSSLYGYVYITIYTDNLHLQLI